MKYKGKSLSALQTIENRISVLENVLEYNKPISKEDFIKTLHDIKKHVNHVIELIDLEYDDTAKFDIG